jgi:hypothetical protein
MCGIALTIQVRATRIRRLHRLKEQGHCRAALRDLRAFSSLAGTRMMEFSGHANQAGV